MTDALNFRVRGRDFAVPAYKGRHGWIGVRFEPSPDDREELAAMLVVASRLVAPKRLSVQL